MSIELQLEKIYIYFLLKRQSDQIPVRKSKTHFQRNDEFQKKWMSPWSGGETLNTGSVRKDGG